MLTSTVENYLKTILKMEDMKLRASTSRVARQLDVADASVTDMLRKLQKAGLLEYRPYYGASLTDRGRKTALMILRRHRLIEQFLHQVLGYGWERVHDEAERLEHEVSDFFIQKLDDLLGHPAKDPHGEAIPDAEGGRAEEEDICLADARPGGHTIHRVTSREPEFFAYLEREGLLPSHTFRLLDRVPYQGPLKIQLEGKKFPQYIGLEAARLIYVIPATPGVMTKKKESRVAAHRSLRPADPRQHVRVSVTRRKR